MFPIHINIRKTRDFRSD